MKKKRSLKLISMVLCLVMILSTLTGCDGDSAKEPEERYIASIMMAYNDAGEYTGTIELGEETDDVFNDVNSEDFVLEVFAGGEEAEAEINNLTVTKKSDKELEISFVSPFGYNDSFSYVLSSNKAVTKNNAPISAMIYITIPDVDMDMKWTGAYRGSDELNIVMTLDSGYKFADVLASNMIILPENLDLDVEVTRVSDTEATVRIIDIPMNYTTNYFEFVLSSEAIASDDIVEDEDICIEFAQPYLNVDEATIKKDEENGTVEIGKIIVPDGMMGVANGIDTSDTYATIEAQNYDSATNSYSVKLKLNKEQISETSYDEVIKNVILSVTFKNDMEEFYYNFAPFSFTMDVNAYTEDKRDEGLYSVVITPFMGKFDSNLKLEDITIENSDVLKDLKLVSVSEDKVELAFVYDEEFKTSKVVKFSIDESKIISNYDIERAYVNVVIPAYSDSKDITWSEAASILGKSAASAAGGALASSIVGLVLPAVYDAMGIDTVSEDTKMITAHINQLSNAINDLAYDIGSLSVNVSIQADKQRLDEFQDLESDLSVINTTILSNSDVIEYVRELKQGVHEVNVGVKDFNKYMSYFRRIFMYDDKDMSYNDHMENYEKLIELFRDANKYGIGYIEMMLDTDSYWRDNELYNPELATDGITLDLYDMYEEMKNYAHLNETGIEFTPCDPSPAFIELVNTYNVNGDFIKTVKKYGDKIIETSSGTGEGIITLYNRVVNESFNFESQVNDAKRAFVSKVQNTYLCSIAIAIQYCDDTNNTGTADMLRNQFEKVMQIIDENFKMLNENKYLLTQGKDIVLVKNAVVSKELVVTHHPMDNWRDRHVVYEIGIRDIETMVDRAARRNRTLAEDLTKAGFIGVEANEANTYCYWTGHDEVEFNDTFISVMGSVFPSLVGIKNTELCRTDRADVLEQSSVANKTIKWNAAVNIVYNDWGKTGWFSCDHRYEAQYKCLLSFGRV